MGGKQNRTRNNVRPSNSGRSAAMLHSSLPQFAGFSGANKPSGLTSFTLNPTDEFDSSIDDNFQLVLKKVSKKDCTTKLKGLQELADLLQKTEPPIVKTLLPIWPRFYSVLVIHPDKRIREATQNVHNIIVLKVKRDIAPYLKQIMAPWYTSQFDNYPPAAMVATQAFKDTFSPVKFKEAVNFCHLEILNYIHDNLLVQTAQTIASSQLSPQEADARYERVVISCLQGYSMYLKEVSEEKITESASLNAQITSNKKFWKLATSKVPLVRSSWFQVLSVILQKAVYLLKNRESQTLSTILNSLEDDESTVLPHIWECLLLATSISEWWKCVNIDQHFIPKVLNVLKQAGNGNAAIIYPNFLPLLANVPSMEEKKKKQFFVNFFENMSTGIRLKPVASSSQETKAISVAYVECLQFLIMKNLSNIMFCKTLIKQLCSLIEWCLSKEAVSYNIIFVQISNFVLYLGKNSNLEDIQMLTDHFFTLLNDIFYRSLNHSNSSVVGKQVELLLSLKSIDLAKENQSVLASGDFYQSTIQKFGVQIFEMYLNHIEQVPCNEVLAQLYVLINGFGKHILFGSLLKQLNKDNLEPCYMDIYRKWFKQWLLSDKMYCKSVLDLIFLLLPDLEDHDKEIILNDLIQINQPDCVIWSVSRALSPPHVGDSVIQKWLKGETVGNLFVSIARRYTGGEECTPELTKIFKSLLAENVRGELLVDKEVLNKMIEQVSSVIMECEEMSSLDSTCSLAAHICQVIYTPTHQLTYQDKLLMTLFNLSCAFDGESNPLSVDTISEVNSVWRNSLTILLQNLNDVDGQTLIEKFFKIIENNFRLTLINGRRGHIDYLNHIVMEIVCIIYKSRISLLVSLLDLLFQKSWMVRESIVAFCKVAEYVKGILESPYEEVTVQKFVDQDQMLSYFVYNFVKIQVLSTSLNQNQEVVSQDSSADDIEVDSDNIRSFNLVAKPEDNLLELLYSYTVTDTFLKHFNNVKYYNEICHFHYLFEQRLYEIFEYIDGDTLSELKRLLKTNCFSHGWLWCTAMYIFYTKILKVEDIFSVYNDLMENVTEVDSTGTLHIKQIFKTVIEEQGANASTENPNNKVESLFKEIESLRNENLSQFLYDNCEMSWKHMNQVIQAIKQCTVLMETSTLTQRHWDFIVISLVSWVSNCLKARQMVKQYQYQAMLVSAAELYMSTCKKVAKLKEEQTNLTFVNEWEDILFEGIHADVAQIWLFLAESCSKYVEDSLLNLPFLQGFGKVTDFLRHDMIFKESGNVPKWTKFLKICSCTLLTNSQAVLQIWGYKMLLILIPGLAKIDDDAVNTTTPHRNGLIFEQFKAKLIEVQDIVNIVLINFKIGENSCKVEPSYDSFTYTFAYLLLWDVMLRLCEKSSAELRYQYSDWLKNGSLLHYLLSNLFKLMPFEILQQDEGKLKVFTDNFLNNPVDSACYSKFCSSQTIEDLACFLYKSSLVQLPALVRQWWTDLDIKTSQIVERVTVLYVSPHICYSELHNVFEHQNAFKNLKVKVLPAIREIQAVYTVDETQMELTITLPSNYPLGSPNILCNRQISGTSQKQWLLQFKKCVLHQNGNIWDGLSLWNSNLDRKFDGVEECYICYAVLHSGTYQLPKLCCRTCKKKFHSACLYKWFSTSNKSSCPICRNLF